MNAEASRQLEIPGLAEQLEAPGGPSEGSKITLRIAGNRSRLLRVLYRLDGREDPEHSMHGVFTGLGEDYHRHVGQALITAALASEDDSWLNEMEGLLDG
jgi:hypothetical protein